MKTGSVNLKLVVRKTLGQAKWRGILQNSSLDPKMSTLPLQDCSESPQVGRTPRPLTDEWVDKMRHIHTMEYYLAIKRNEVSIHAACHMDDS